MKFTPTAVVVAAISLAGSAAYAQDATVQGSGYQVGEGTVVHPSIGAETGFISNVFYEDKTPISSGILRLLATIAIEPKHDRGTKGAEQASLDFSAGARLEYSEYISSNSNAQDQRSLGGGADLMLGLMSSATFPLTLEDHFIRTNRPTNFESSSTLFRDVNSFKAGLGFRPEGRNISGRLHYTNTVDYFEGDSAQFANRMLNNFELGVDWQLLPITRFFAQGSYGFFGGLGGGSTKVSSSPIRGTAGIATAVTESVTLRAHGGYAIGGYASGASYSDFVYHLEGGYRYSPLGRVVLMFDRNYKDSINSNYYGEYMTKLAVDQQVNRVLVEGNIAARIRNYGGVDMALGGGPSRDDFILSSGIKASLELRDWLSLNASYDLQIVQTDFVAMVGGEPDDPSYVRHEAVVGAMGAF